MASSSLPFPPTQQQQSRDATKADQIVWRYLNKVVLVLAHARLTTDSNDQDGGGGGPVVAEGGGASTPGGRGISDLDDGGGTPTGSISVVAPHTTAAPAASGSNKTAPAAKAKQSGPRMDKWFNLEIPDLDTFKRTLTVFRGISTTFPVVPTDAGIAIDPPPLIVQVLLCIPQPVNQVLVLTHSSSHRTRIDPTPRYILLESWRVDISRPSRGHGGGGGGGASVSSTSSTTSSRSLSTSGTSSSVCNVELPTVYKQSIALFRSMHTLLRSLPAWKLHRRLRKKTRTQGMSIELRVDVVPRQSPSSSASSAATDDLPPRFDNSPIVDFHTPLSQHASAIKTESFTFPSVPSPLGELTLSTKYRTETNFTLEPLESLLSSGFFNADQQKSSGAPGALELFSILPNPPPNYPRPPYPPVSGALTREEEERERRRRAISPPSTSSSAQRRGGESAWEEDQDQDWDADFTPTVVAEQQRLRRESQTQLQAARAPGGIPYGSPSAAAAGRFPPGYVPPPPARSSHSPRSQPSSLPREPLAGIPRSFGSEKVSPSGSVYSVTGTAGAVPPRSRLHSIPHSSSPLSSQSPRPSDVAALRYPLQPLPHLPSLSPIITTPTQYSTQHPLPTHTPGASGGRYSQQNPSEAPPMHSRTISMPSSASRPLTSMGGSPMPMSGTGARFNVADLPFAVSGSGVGNVTTTGIRRRKESTSALSSTTSSGGGASGMPASPTRPGLTYSPRSRPTPLPTPTPPFSRRETPQTTPPQGARAVPLPVSGSGPRRPSLNTIHPFKSSTLSSSPGSFSTGRMNSPLSERGTPSPALVGGVAPTSAAAPAAPGQQFASYGSTKQLAGGTATSSQPPRSPIGAKHPTTGTTESPPHPYGSHSPGGGVAETSLSSKRLSGSSMESGGGVPGSRRLSAYSPDLGAAGVAVPAVKRVSSSFSHRYVNSTSTTGSGGGVPGSLGSGGSGNEATPIGPRPAGAVPTATIGSIRGDSLGLAGVSGAVPPTVEGRGRQLYSGVAPTDDDDIHAFVRTIDSRPQLRGGTPPSSSRLSGSPASNRSTGSLPRVPVATVAATAAPRPEMPPIATYETLARIREDSSASEASYSHSPASPSQADSPSTRMAVGSLADYDTEMSRRLAQFDQSVNVASHRRQRSAASEDDGGVRQQQQQQGSVRSAAPSSLRRAAPNLRERTDSQGSAGLGTGRSSRPL